MYGVHSDELVLGAPQGRVPSPLLFYIDRNEMTENSETVQIC